MSDIINKTVQALNSKPIGLRAPPTQEEVLQTISDTAKGLNRIPLYQGSNQYLNIKQEEVVVPSYKTANVREKVQHVDIGKDLINGAIEKLNRKPQIKL